MPGLLEEAAAFLLADQSDERYSSCSMAVCKAIREGSLSIPGLVSTFQSSHPVHSFVQDKIGKGWSTWQVKGLAEPLTSTQEVPRSRAVLLLSEVPAHVFAVHSLLIVSCTFLDIRSLCLQVVGNCPEALATPGEVHHLAGFFTARLADWCAALATYHPVFRLFFKR